MEGWPAPCRSLDEEDVRWLNKEFLLEEVETVIRQGGGYVAPEKDGMSYSFFKCYWSIIKEDFWNALAQFFYSAMMCEDWKRNQSFVLSFS